MSFCKGCILTLCAIAVPLSPCASAGEMARIAPFALDEASRGVLRLLREKLKGLAAFSEPEQVNRPLSLKAAAEVAAGSGASYALLLNSYTEDKKLCVEVRLVALPKTTAELHSTVCESSPARAATKIAWQIEPFLRGVNISSLPDILRRLSSEREETALRARAELEAMRGEAISLTLIEALTETSNPAARIALSEKLARIGDPLAMPELLNVLRSANDEKSAHASSGFRCRFGVPLCELAGKIRSREAAPLIARLLQAEQERAPELAQIAYGAERKLGPDMVTLTAKERARAKRQAEYYSRLLEESGRFQRAAIAALGQIAEGETAPVLLATLRIAQYTTAAQEALLQMGPAASHALLDSMDDPAIGALCIRLLGEIGDQSTLEVLLKKLATAPPFTKLLLIESIGKIPSERSAASIRPYLDDRYLAPAVIEALGRLKDTQSVPRLERFLRSATLRSAALQALGSIGTERALHSAFSVLRAAESVAERRRLIAALGRTANPAVVRELIRHLSDRAVREAVLAALRRIGTPAERPLLRALRSHDWRMRRNAIYLLGILGGEEARETLRTITEQNDAELAFMARAAMKQLEK